VFEAAPDFGERKANEVGVDQFVRLISTLTEAGRAVRRQTSQLPASCDCAAAEEVECHGVLWLIDLMHTERVVEAAILRAGLEQLARHPRCRLPRTEIDIRLVRLSDADWRRKRSQIE
jgi:hypothetical protein